MTTQLQLAVVVLVLVLIVVVVVVVTIIIIIHPKYFMAQLLIKHGQKQRLLS